MPATAWGRTVHILPAARPQGRLASGTGPQGHRGRMRARLLSAPGALADYEVLEMLLFLGIERRDTKPMAKGLINRFGSLRAVVGAERAALLDAGVAAGAADVLAMVTEAAAALARAERRVPVVLGDWAALERYLGRDLGRPGIRGAVRQPGLHALLLDNRNQLLGECVCEGADPPQALLRQALARHASAAVLVRQQVGTARLNPGDPALFERCVEAGAALSVVVHDLVVAGDGPGVVSLRQGGPDASRGR